MLFLRKNFHFYENFKKAQRSLLYYLIAAMLCWEFEEENFERRNNKGKNIIIIEITAYKGRSKEAKKLLYKMVTEKLVKELGMEAKDVIIYINEPDLENCGISGKAADEINLGFKINV